MGDFHWKRKKEAERREKERIEEEGKGENEIESEVKGFVKDRNTANWDL